jgi:hypothetical protein
MSTLPLELALVSETKQVDPRDLTKISAALQKQVSRDFGPIWDVSATIDAFVALEDVPIGYWPIIVEVDIKTPGAAGIHLDRDGQPFALVEYSNTWSLTASHECLEMLGDPWGNRIVAGPSVKAGQGRVEYLVEVCDPCEAAELGYQVNGIIVSDFYTPSYFDPVAASGTRYSFTGAIKAPRKVLKGGYLSWHELTKDHWWQEVYFGKRPQYRDLGVLGDLKENIRQAIDSQTPLVDLAPELAGGLPPEHPTLVAALAAAATIEPSTASKASMWRRQIAALKG